MTWLLFWLFVVIQALDVWTTGTALKRGAEEANFLPAALIRSFGFWPAILGVKIVATAVTLAVTIFVANAYWFTGTLGLIGMGVLVNNWRVLRSL